MLETYSKQEYGFTLIIKMPCYLINNIFSDMP
jgi:hypothetical protein